MEELPLVEMAGSEQGMLSLKPKWRVFLLSYVRVEHLHADCLLVTVSHGKWPTMMRMWWQVGTGQMSAGFHRIK